MPVALGVNGGVLGSNNLPSSGSAKGIWTPNEIARAVALGFWPVNYARSITETATGADVISTGANADPYFNLTTLLLSTTATNGQQNNTFQDSSTNNFTITRNPATGPNAPTQGTFSPFSQTGWSNYFDGTSDYLTVNDNAALELGSSNFCLEFMYYPTSSANTDFVTKRVNASSYGVIIVQTGLALNFWLSSSGSSWDLFSNVALGSVTLNAWNHLAIYRIGNAWYSSLNGTITTLSASLSGSVVNNAANWNIGGSNYASGSVIGYLSNFRLVIGSSVYTSTSAPIPTAPLTAVTNTQLLTCQSNRFLDNSTNNFAVTPTGNTTVVPFSPFNPTSAWSASTVGGSGYFDGTGDYLSTTPSSSAFSFGTGDFTIEYWVYINSGTNNGIFQLSDTAGGLKPSQANSLAMNIFTNNSVSIYANGTSYQAPNNTLPYNSWTHFAIVRSSNVTKLYANGSLVTSIGSSGSITDNTNYTGLYVAVGGYYSTAYLMTGYVSNFRVVKGTAVYTGNFTPPTAPLTAITNTSLLLNFTNAGIYDATAKNVLETVGNAQVSTAQSKWSPTSMLFNSDTSWLQQPASVLYGFGTGNFTVECWFYLTASPTTEKGIFHINTTINNTTAGYAVSTTTTGFNFYANGTFYASTTTAPVGQWNHLAYVKNSGTVNVYLNGTLIQNGSKADSQNLTNPLCYVGLIYTTNSGPLRYLGYMQDFRVTRGYARYTANFTPPTAAFPVQ